MKRMNYKRKFISYMVIWSVLLSSFLLYSPKTIALSASGVPEIKMLTPEAGAVFDVSTVEFTGKISDVLTTSDKLSVKVFEQLGDSQQPIDITDEGKLTITPQDKYADFSYSKDFSEGNHTLFFVVTDEDGVSTKVDQSFTVMKAGTEQKNGTSSAAVNEEASPVKSSPEEIKTSQASTQETSESQGVTEGPDSSQPPNEEIGIRPYMENIYLIPKGTEDTYNPRERDVPSNFLPAEDMTRVPLNYQILIDIRSAESLPVDQPLITIFGEKGNEKRVITTEITNDIKSYVYTYTPDNQLAPGTTYYVYLNPNFSNVSEKNIIPRFLKFTTVSSNYEKYQFPASKGNDVREKDYIHGPFSNVTNACAYCHSTHNGTSPSLEGGKYGSEANNLCMACHDGTNGSPKIENNYGNNEHFKGDSDVSCSSCHNPHTPGTKNNPNSMHQNKAYKKASTTTGSGKDFSLCLSCHNGGKDSKSGKLISNIEQYYNDEALIAQSGHNIQATEDSGSSLNGQLPCAECHETHGSNNIKMLREELGNIKIKDEKEKFNTIGKEWNIANERNFCLKCHSNSAVSSIKLYGRTAQFKEKNSDGEVIIGHRLVEDKGQSCAICHGGASKTFMEAAHSPEKLPK